ncbi:hypothetical protein D3C80_2127910 [compost metagenome]
MIKPPMAIFGYKLVKLSIVEEYISPSSLAIAICLMGALGSVSLNHPFRKVT